MSLDDARELHREVIENARAGDAVQTVAVAQRYLAEHGQDDDPDVRSLTAGVTFMWLGAIAQQDPDRALAQCDVVFERYREVSGPEFAAVAALALRIEIGLRVTAGEIPAALEIVDRLIEFVGGQTGGAAFQCAGQAVAASKRLIRGEQEAAAISLLKPLVDRFADAEDAAQRSLAAVAQLWILIALTYQGSEGPLPDEVRRLDTMGDDLQHALGRLMGELSGDRYWARALILLVVLLVEVYDSTGQDVKARETREGFVQAYGSATAPAAKALVEQYQRDLAGT